MKRKSWDLRKEKKARFKRSIKRHLKRGEKIYGGYVRIDDLDYLKWPPDDVWIEEYLPCIEGRCIPERRLNLKDGKWIHESRYPAPDPDDEDDHEEIK